jgi:hypothetical protein
MTEKIEVLPGALYDVQETAQILGFAKRPKSIYDIPDSELIPTWVGARRGKKMFRGSDILQYMERGRSGSSSAKLSLAS